MNQTNQSEKTAGIHKFLCSECDGMGSIFDDDDREECQWCLGTGIDNLENPEEFKADLEALSTDAYGRTIKTHLVIEHGHVIGVTNGTHTLFYAEYSPAQNAARKERIAAEQRRAKAMSKIRDLWPEPPAPWPPAGPLIVDRLIDNTKAPIVAICGYSGAGKDTVSSMLHDALGTTRIDDGEPLREAVMALYNLSRHDVTTQGGKERTVTIGDQSATVRELLGAMGTHIESLFGPHVLAVLSLERVAARRKGKTHLFVCPSVRRTQGRVYREAGAFVIGIRRPDHGPRSEYDIFAEDAVHLWLDNDGTIADLNQKVKENVVPALWNHFRADLRLAAASAENRETAEASLTVGGR